MNVVHDSHSQHDGRAPSLTEVTMAALSKGDAVDLETEGGSHYRFIVARAALRCPSGDLVREPKPSRWEATAVGAIDPGSGALDSDTIALGKRALFSVVRAPDTCADGYEYLLTSRVIRLRVGRRRAAA
jgi:hypothetical protein